MLHGSKQQLSILFFLFIFFLVGLVKLFAVQVSKKSLALSPAMTSEDFKQSSWGQGFLALFMLCGESSLSSPSIHGKTIPHGEFSNDVILEEGRFVYFLFECPNETKEKRELKFLTSYPLTSRAWICLLLNIIWIMWSYSCFLCDKRCDLTERQTHGETVYFIQTSCATHGWKLFAPEMLLITFYIYLW